MKKLRPVFLFIAASLIILLIFSIYYWNYSKDNPEDIQHVRLEDWSIPAGVADNIATNSYDTLFAEEEFSLFTTARADDERTINQTILDYNGQVLEKTELARAGHAGFPKTAAFSGENYLFYFAGTSSSNQNLMAKNLNENGDPITLREDIGYPNTLSITKADDKLILTYIEKGKETGQNVISVLGYEDLNSEQTFYNTNSFEEEVGYPKIASIEDEVFLIWHKRNPETMFISGQEDRFNRYLLNIGQLDLETGELEQKAVLGEAYGNNANIDISVLNDQLWISWVRYDRDDEKDITETGYLDNGEDYQEFTRIPGFNPALSIKDDEKIIINSQELETRGQAALYINRFTDAGADTNNRRIFPSLSFSSNSKIINHEDSQHLLWTEPASSGSDIYYSNTVEAESIGVMEFMGFDIISSPLELISSLGLYFSYPIFAINIGLINFLIPITIVGLILYLLSKKFTMISDLNNETPYLSFISMVLGVLAFNVFFQENLGYLFSMSEPPAEEIPIIIGGVTLVALGFIYFLKYEEDHSLYVGIGSVLLWFYWLTQAGLIYELHRFFV